MVYAQIAWLLCHACIPDTTMAGMGDRFKDKLYIRLMIYSRGVFGQLMGAVERNGYGQTAINIRINLVTYSSFIFHWPFPYPVL